MTCRKNGDDPWNDNDNFMQKVNLIQIVFSRLGYILPIKSDNLIDVSTVRLLGGMNWIKA